MLGSRDESESPRMTDPIVVRVDPDLHELVPDFLRNRRDDVRVLRDALAATD